MKYRVLYLLQSANLLLFEIQRLGLPAATPTHEVYQWFLYSLSTNQLTPLTFSSMQSSPPFEVRQFAEGTLRFSNMEGVFTPAGSLNTIALRRDFLVELPPALTEQLQHFQFPRA